MSTIERLLSAVYSREPHVKVVAAVTGSVSNSSLMVDCCSAQTSECMAMAAWKMATDIMRREAEADGTQTAAALPNVLKRFRAAVGIACTAGLATNYTKMGPHECFISVCHVRSVSESSVLLRPQYETYHLQLDKTLGRSRTEEDHIVSRWLVYLLAKAANVLPNACNTFYNELMSTQSKSDVFMKLTSDDIVVSTSDLLDDICAGKLDNLVSLAFLPNFAENSAENAPLALQEFEFRGLILPGSFNPLHKGHVDLARVAQQLFKARSGVDLPVAFEIAIANADKGALQSSTIRERVEQFRDSSAMKLGAWPVLVTNATLFGQKAELFPGCTFIIGADTAIRIVDKKYYDMDEHKMVLAMDRIARHGCSFVVAGRFGNKLGEHFISADEVLSKYVPPVFRHLFLPVPESTFRNDISSSKIRQERALH
ncbi:Rossmann-like alpha/beta/alpha sandwich fold [Plasmopara halstedii]|uniref:Rossmann-like alpha/beta/alpha sandwich fold n=1 Tax=Plasmopara halstedii TaxID=4781 RepID=A0A0N7L832_PLAHL|nr:Rossmann-like alpha/beta/alpha sandwich fold [Plasmopara halstedii]CEG48747.1 Rossmann-like alpha/beta/alpha sandwich fold [Plasmopara halstedii]|eukprot:XP_024585116.1 Rossmann-like alpha/beta/alpha sandwich fold [Plasmopara halstedii]